MLTRRMAILSAAAIAASGPAGAQEGLHMASPRAAHAAVLLADGSVLLIGGCTGHGCGMGPASGGVERYDPKRGVIEPAGRLVTARGGPATMVLPDGRVVLAGGWARGGATDSIEVFDPKTGVSREVARMSVARGDYAAAPLADGRLLIAGGVTGRDALALVEAFDPRTGRVERLGDLPRPRAIGTATRLADGRVLLAGGTPVYSGPAIGPADLFDPRTGRTTPTGVMLQPRYKHAAVRLPDGRVLFVGGSGMGDREAKLTSFEIYDPRTGRFAIAGEALTARFKIADSVVALPDGRVLIAGGGEQPELFDPASRRSRLVDVAPDIARNFETAVLLPSGDALVAGGYSERGIRLTDRVAIIPRAKLA